MCQAQPYTPKLTQAHCKFRGLASPGRSQDQWDIFGWRGALEEYQALNSRPLVDCTVRQRVHVGNKGTTCIRRLLLWDGGQGLWRKSCDTAVSVAQYSSGLPVLIQLACVCSRVPARGGFELLLPCTYCVGLCPGRLAGVAAQNYWRLALLCNDSGALHAGESAAILQQASSRRQMGESSTDEETCRNLSLLETRYAAAAMHHTTRGDRAATLRFSGRPKKLEKPFWDEFFLSQILSEIFWLTAWRYMDLRH